MVQFRLIGEDYFDNFGDEGFSYTRKSIDFQKPDLTFNDYSQSVRLPATQKNNKLFKFYYNPSVQNGFNPFTKNECELWVNDQLFSTGALMFLSAQYKNGEVSQYTVQFFSDTINLKDALQDKGINDLPWQDLNHTMTNVDVKNYLSGTAAGAGGLMYYPMATMSSFWVWDLAGGGSIEGIRKIKSTEDGILNTEVRPSMPISEIVDRIFKAAEFSYRVDFDSEDYWNELYMWVNNGRNVVSITQVVQGGVGSGTQTVIDPSIRRVIYSRSIVDDSKLYSTLTGISTIAVTGTYTLTTYFDVNIFGGTPQYRIVINGTPGLWFNIINQTEQLNNLGVLNSGDTVSIDSRVDGLERYGSLETGTTFILEGSNASAFDFMEVSKFMPDMKCIDFIKGLLVTFNAIMYFDSVADEFVIKHRDQWFLDGNTVDLSQYINTDDRTIKPPTFYKTYGFEFLQGEDLLNLSYKETNTRGYGSAFYDTGMYFGNTYVSKCPFTSNIWAEVIEENNQGGIVIASDIAAFFSVDKAFKNVDSGVRLMYRNGTKVANGTYKVVDADGSSGGTATNYNLFLNNLTTDDVNLSFQPEHDFKHSGAGINESNLYTKFYASYIAGIYNPNVRRVSVVATMPYAKLKVLQTNDTIVWDGVEFLIDKMVLDVISNKVKLDLINKS